MLPTAVRRDRERGAASVEYVGIVVAVVVLVAALLVGVSRFGIAERIGCAIRSIGTQAGACGGVETPTTYGTTETEAGGTPTDVVQYVNGSGDRPQVNAARVDVALEDLREALTGGFWGVRGGDLDDARSALEGLNGAELDALVANLDDAELEQWVSQMEDGWLFGGWDRDERRSLWELLASNASKETLDRLAGITDELQPAFDTVGGDGARDNPESPRYTGAYGEVPHRLVVGGIEPGDVSQGWIGDCWYIASMMAVAQADPTVIEDAITANDNGTYTVRLYDDGSPVDVTVTPEMVLNPDGTPAFVANDGGTEPYEMWPMVLEKALALHYGDFEDIEDGTASVGLELLTGLPSSDYEPGDVSLADISQVLENGGAVGLSSLRKGDGADNPLYAEDAGADRLFRGHAYYVSDVDVDAGTVTVVNPWGIGDWPPITLSVEEFTESFRRVRTNEVS